MKLDILRALTSFSKTLETKNPISDVSRPNAAEITTKVSITVTLWFFNHWPEISS